MKRHASTDLNDERQTVRRRQEPVSCTSCRKKKLKCSRTFPCSNCVSRRLACEPPDTAPQWESGQESRSDATSSDTNVLARVMERLQRLENIVLDKDSKNGSSSVGHALKSEYLSPASVGHEDETQNKIYHSFDQTGSRGNEDEAQNTAFHKTADSLELSGSRLEGVSEDSDDFVFSSALVSKLNVELSSGTSGLTGISFLGSRLIRRVCLPSRQEAHVLLNSYLRSLGTWYHIIHRPSVVSLLDSTYDLLSQGKPPKLADAALLMSVFASGAYFQAFDSQPKGVFSHSADANQASRYWTRSAHDILNHSNRDGSPTSLELVQATVILSLVVQNLEGTSKKYWLLHGTSITLARDLGLHVLDHPQRKKEDKNLVIDEVKRRVWWYLAATDWLLGSMPSPHEGTYNIHPRHVLTNQPMNVDDDVLALGGDIQDKLLSEPSEMSYFIVRLRGSEVCRVFGDLVHPLALGVNNVNYDEIIALENQIKSFADDHLPFYFKLDDESRKRTEPYLAKYPQLATQRYLLQQGLHCHRSRIHRPFLIRGSLNPRYSFSRQACLESVRKSLEIRRLLNQEKPGLVLPIARLNFVVYHVFMAALTLALDLCFNKSTTEAEDQSRRAELREACIMLQDARTELPAADRFLNPLLDLLRKYKIQLQDNGTLYTYLTPSEPARSPNPTAIPKDVTQPTPTAFSQPQPPEFNYEINQSQLAPDNLDLDGLWQEFIDMVPNSSAPEWDNLFADLDYANLSMGV